MSLSHFLLTGIPAQEISELKQSHKRARRRDRRRDGLMAWRVRELEQDVGYLSLILASLLTKLDESGSVNRQDLKHMMEELDDFDGVKDGRLDISILRAATDDPEGDDSKSGNPEQGQDPSS